MKIKAIIFDLDGVLVDSEPLHFAAHKMAMSECGIKITEDDYIQNGVSGGRRSFYEVMQMKYGKTVDIDEVRKLKKQKYGELIETIKAFEGVKETLDAIKGKYRMAIASMTHLDYVQKTLETVGIAEYFESITSGKDLAHGKPFPDVYFEAMKKLGLSAKECIAVEDSRNGVEAAKNAGLRCIAIPNNYTLKQDLSRADVIIENFNLLQEKIEEMGNL